MIFQSFDANLSVKAPAHSSVKTVFDDSELIKVDLLACVVFEGTFSGSLLMFTNSRLKMPFIL